MIGIANRLEIRNLSVAAYTNGFTSWHYRAGRLSDAMSAGFFDEAGHMLKAGDHISVSAQDGGAVLYVMRPGRTVPMYTTPWSAAA